MEQRQLVGLITRRSLVRIQAPQLSAIIYEAGVRPASSLYQGDFVNKRKRVAIAKHRAKKRKLKAKAQTAR